MFVYFDRRTFPDDIALLLQVEFFLLTLTSYSTNMAVEPLLSMRWADAMQGVIFWWVMCHIYHILSSQSLPQLQRRSFRLSMDNICSCSTGASGFR